MGKSGRYRLRLLSLCVSLLLVILSLAPLPSAFAQQASVEVTVYRDGVVTVIHTITLNETITSIPVKLLASSVESVLVLDEKNLPVGYDLTPPDMTIKSLGATRITVEYDTSALTSKNGTIWTLSLDAPFDLNVILPEQAVILSMSGVPRTIVNNGSRTLLTLGSGAWQINYVQSAIAIPSEGEKQVTTLSPLPFDYSTLFLLIGLAASGLLLGVWLRHRSARRFVSQSELRPEDKDVLTFIEEKGGRVLEVELSRRFPLPKTTMWRLVRRLERASLIRVNKIGLQNQIELVK